MSDGCRNCALCILTRNKVFTVAIVTYSPGRNNSKIAYLKGLQDYGGGGEIPAALVCLARDAFKDKLPIGDTTVSTQMSSTGKESETTVKRLGRFQYRIGFKLNDDAEYDGDEPEMENPTN